VESALQAAKVGYHGKCELKVQKPSVSRYLKKKKQKKYDDSIEASDGENNAEYKERVFLSLGSIRCKGDTYHKNDIWVLSNAPTFLGVPKFAGTQKPWACIVKSLWHGPNQDGKYVVMGLLSVE